MKIYAYILIVLSGVLTAQCSKVTLDEICGYPSAPGGGNGEGEGNGDYNSYWYYSYEAAQLIDAETLGMETAEDFTPYTVAHLGDTLFIANIFPRYGAKRLGRSLGMEFQALSQVSLTHSSASR